MATPAQRLQELPKLRSELAARLAFADDEAFVQMLWALNALQTGRIAVALPYFRAIPDGAATEGILGPHAVYPWELETLGNELLATAKDPTYRFFDSRGWSAIADLVNLLRAVENAEYGARRGELNILREMGRIGARQFEWQRGFYNVAEIYRSAFIYGQGECAQFFEQTHGISIATMMFVGFALVVGFRELPVMRPDKDLDILHELGVNIRDLAQVLSIIARPHSELRAEAALLRQPGDAIAYKPSVFRRYPCILMGPRGRRMRTPLPDLIASRVTSGLFYDVVGGGGQIRDEYGRRFECYAHALLCALLPGAHFEREWSYDSVLGQCRSPDILMTDATGAVLLATECKATKMGIGARFSEDPVGERGYEEIARGVFQCWRFFAHCRRGLTGRMATRTAKCLVLTLDEWFAARGPVLDEVLQRANTLADEDDQDITADDRRPVAFCSISDLEAVLHFATEQSFLASVDLASDNRRGWMFSSVHQEIDAPKTDAKDYPFEDQIGQILPWWTHLSEEE